MVPPVPDGAFAYIRIPSGHAPGKIQLQQLFSVTVAASNQLLNIHQLQLKGQSMKTVTMLEFRRNAEGVLRRVAKGERFVLSHRGKPAARLEPLSSPSPVDPASDPFLSIARRAKPSPKGKTPHKAIDQILYGRR
jgi:prevent-host-death family protein